MRSDKLAPTRAAVLARVDERPVLEIGFGTGANLPHYPPALSELHVVEPNERLMRLGQQRGTAAGIAVRRVNGCGCRLRDTASNTFGTVVMTWTLCSVADPYVMIGEIWRVLRSGGCFVFAEHGQAPDPSVRRWQTRLTPLTALLDNGCRLTLNIPELLRQFPFRWDYFQERYLPGFWRILGYTYVGVLRKR